MRSVLFVCTGNICRSPTAEAVFKRRTGALGIAADCDSAGTHAYHVDEPPDPRSISVAVSHGVEGMSDQFARKLVTSDYDRFDYLIAMDKGHEMIMREKSPSTEHHRKVKLLLDYHDDYRGMDVPDPYYGDLSDFEHTYKLIEKGIDAFITQEF